MSKICPVCKQPYISKTLHQNPAIKGARKQEWYKHTDDNWCTRTAPKEK